MNKNIKSFLTNFSIILSSTLIFSTIFIFVFSIKTIDRSFLWQIILISLINTFFGLIYYSNGWINTKPLYFKMIIHFSLVYVFFIFSGAFFGWFKVSDTAFILYFSLFILIGYAVAFIVIYLYECNQAKLLNKKLSEYKHKRSEV